VFSSLSDRVSEGSVYGGSVVVQGSLSFKPVSDTADGGPSTDFHLGPSDIVPLFQNSMVKFNRYAIFVVTIVLIHVFIGV
jgi:hypothetical protein